MDIDAPVDAATRAGSVSPRCRKHSTADTNAYYPAVLMWRKKFALRGVLNYFHVTTDVKTCVRKLAKRDANKQCACAVCADTKSKFPVIQPNQTRKKSPDTVRNSVILYFHANINVRERVENVGKEEFTFPVRVDATGNSFAVIFVSKSVQNRVIHAKGCLRIYVITSGTLIAAPSTRKRNARKTATGSVCTINARKNAGSCAIGQDAISHVRKCCIVAILAWVCAENGVRSCASFVTSIADRSWCLLGMTARKLKTRGSSNSSTVVITLRSKVLTVGWKKTKVLSVSKDVRGVALQSGDAVDTGMSSNSSWKTSKRQK